MEKITCIIVLYNKSIETSATFLGIRSHLDLDVLVVDNSIEKNNNASLCKQYGARYLSMNGNKGLSKAYNEAIEASKGSDVYILFDDDTAVTDRYFAVLAEALKKWPEVDIFAPIVYGQDGVIYSPNESHFMRNRFIKNAEQLISPKKFNAISSCLAIRRHVFESYRFNEILFVDQVDQNFFNDQRRLGRKCMKLGVSIEQNFHQRGKTLTPEAGWNRLGLRILDVFRHARLMGASGYTFLAFIKCCGLGIQTGKKSKSPGIIVKAGLLSAKLLVFPE